MFLPTTILTYGKKDSMIAKPTQKPSVNIVVNVKNAKGYFTNEASPLEICWIII